MIRTPDPLSKHEQEKEIRRDGLALFEDGKKGAFFR
jgi:hypothetical protein